MLSLPLAIRSALVVLAGKPLWEPGEGLCSGAAPEGTPVRLLLRVPPLQLPALSFLPVLSRDCLILWGPAL